MFSMFVFISSRTAIMVRVRLTQDSVSYSGVVQDVCQTLSASNISTWMAVNMATVDITGLLTDTHLVSEGKYSSKELVIVNSLLQCEVPPS